MEIVPVATVDEVLAKALVAPLVPIEWEDRSDEVAPRKTEEAGATGLMTH